jgi:hypothetical protein
VLFGVRPSSILGCEDLSDVERFAVDVEAAKMLQPQSLADEIEDRWRRLGVYR